MICRRGGISKGDIGAIRIFDTSTEFEISARAADEFAAKIKRPDKEDNIRIEALPDGPQGNAAPEARSKPDYKSRNNGKPAHRGHHDRQENPRREEKPRYDDKPRHEAKPQRDKPFRFEDAPPRAIKNKHGANPGHQSKPSFARPDFAKKPKKKKNRG
jgi:ATP-dependent RNA helicase DeaD